MSFPTILDKTECNTKKSTFIFPLPPFSPIQCCRVAIVGSLAENPISRCVSRSLIKIEWGDRRDCRSVTLVLSTIVVGSGRSPKSYLYFQGFRGLKLLLMVT